MTRAHLVAIVGAVAGVLAGACGCPSPITPSMPVGGKTFHGRDGAEGHVFVVASDLRSVTHTFTRDGHVHVISYGQYTATH